MYGDLYSAFALSLNLYHLADYICNRDYDDGEQCGEG
jgi:hypothetical protein